MDLFAPIGALHQALDYHLDRHNLLVSNVAHVDTPGYVPRDLKRVEPGSFGAALDVAMARTDARHIAGSEPGFQNAQVIEDPAAGAGNDLNAVSLDREAAKVAANQIRYDVVAQITSTQLANLAWAAGDGRSAG